jgi:hypothetical protein
MIEPPEGPISKNKICCTTVLWCASMDLDQLKENTVITLSWDLIQPRCGDSHSLECNLHSQAHRTRVSGSNDQGHKPFPFVDLCVDRLFFFFCVSSLIPAQGTGQICHCTNTKVDKFYRNVCIGSWTLEIGH